MLEKGSRVCGWQSKVAVGQSSAPGHTSLGSGSTAAPDIPQDHRHMVVPEF